MSRKLVACKILILAAAVTIFTPFGTTQLSRMDREQAQAMLEAVTSDVRQSYFDPKLLGPDWETRIRKAKERIANATSVQTATSEIAAVLESLNDSHTVFAPPKYSARAEYGWQFQMMGDRCYVTHVLPGSDAEAKGLRPGGEVIAIDGVMPTRENLWKMKYTLNVLAPRYALLVSLLDPSGKRIRKVDVEAKVRRLQEVRINVWDYNAATNATLDAQEQRRSSRVRYQDMGPDLMIFKIPSFTQPESEVENLLSRARNHKTLIMDLRNNPGGISDVLKSWVGGMFQDDVRIADRVSRNKTEAVVAKGNHLHFFSGKLIVLVDSSSASAAELFARVVQIEKRGAVLGDRTSGETRAGRFFSHSANVQFGVTVTQADLVMTDGKSLERLGVAPDETILPSAQDLANNRDPVMARAAEIAGVTLTPENAGKLFPYEWAKDWTYRF